MTTLKGPYVETEANYQYLIRVLSWALGAMFIATVVMALATAWVATRPQERQVFTPSGDMVLAEVVTQLPDAIPERYCRDFLVTYYNYAPSTYVESVNQALTYLAPATAIRLRDMVASTGRVRQVQDDKERSSLVITSAKKVELAGLGENEGAVLAEGLLSVGGIDLKPVRYQVIYLTVRPDRGNPFGIQVESWQPLEDAQATQQ